MTPPTKPSPLHVIAVFAGLILLFTGTWFLVKSKSNPEQPAGPEVVKKATGTKAQPKAEVAAVPVPADTEKKPEPVAAAPSPPPAPDEASAPALSMRDPSLGEPAEPKSTPEPAPAPAPMVAAAPEVDIPEPPVPTATVPAPAPESAPAPAPAPEMAAAEESPKTSEAETPEQDAVLYGPFVIYGPLRPELQPAPSQAVTEASEDKKEKDDSKAKPDEKAMAGEAGKEGDKDADAKKDEKGDKKVADKDKDKDKGKDGKSKPEIIDVTNSIASHHDMEGEPEDGPVTPPSGPPEKTTDIKPTTSNAMPGWELLHYQSRDYVTANSIHRFYRFNNVSVEGKSVWFRSPVLIMKASLGSQELLINNIKFVMSYPVVMLNNQPCFSRLDLCKLIDPVLRPSYIGSTKPFDTVVIDPGHGGSDSGAKGIYGYEKDFALQLAMHLKRVLEQRGIKVVMTRSTDVFLSLGSRVAIANKTPNCIYISLHFNSGGSAATGIETFALSPQGSASIYGARSVDYLAFQGNKLDSENIALATAVHAGVVHHFKLVDRGVKRARWQVLKGLNKPGILFEGGFVTNANDGRLIAADNFRKEMASTIAQSIINYRNALQPRRTAR